LHNYSKIKLAVKIKTSLTLITVLLAHFAVFLLIFYRCFVAVDA
jgi:hypothetical protein